MHPFDKYRVDVPEGVSGDWEVKRFKVERSIELLRMEHDGRGTPEGWYTGLYHKGEGVVMSDTNAEIRDFIGYIGSFEGDVLVTGLGLGCVAQALAKNPKIKKIVIIEQSHDVIKLVSKTLTFKKELWVLPGDAYKHTFGKDIMFDYAWHDIWTAPSTDDLVDMARIKRHYARSMKAPKRQFCWSEDQMRRLKRQGY